MMREPGIFVLCCISLVTFVVGALRFWSKRKVFPVAPRQPRLVIANQIGAALSLALDVSWRASYPAAYPLWWFGIAMPSFYGLFISIFVLRLLRIKYQWALAQQRETSQATAIKLVRRFRLVSSTKMLVGTIVAVELLVVALFGVAVAWEPPDSLWNEAVFVSDENSADSRFNVLITRIVSLLTTIGAAVILYMTHVGLRGVRDGIGFRTELRLTAGVCGVGVSGFLFGQLVFFDTPEVRYAVLIVAVTGTFLSSLWYPVWLADRQVRTSRQKYKQLTPDSNTSPTQKLVTLLVIPEARKAFEQHLRAEFSFENLMFFDSVRALKDQFQVPRSPSLMLRTVSEVDSRFELMKRENVTIFRRFLGRNAPDELNVSAEILGPIRAFFETRLTTDAEKNSPEVCRIIEQCLIFDDCVKEISVLMAHDSLYRFVRRPAFRELPDVVRAAVVMPHEQIL